MPPTVPVHLRVSCSKSFPRLVSSGSPYHASREALDEATESFASSGPPPELAGMNRAAVRRFGIWRGAPLWGNGGTIANHIDSPVAHDT